MNSSITNAKMPQTGDILVVDDTPANLRLLSDMLVKQGYNVRTAPDGSMALTSAQAIPPDIILLDIKMPGLSGYEVCEQLKADPRTRDIPVIFISALDETEDKVKAFTLGGVDYVTKPFQIDEVLARVETHLVLYSLQQRIAGANVELQESNDRLKSEIEKRIQAEAKLQELATTDSLTGLYNRGHFFDLAEREHTRALRYQRDFSLILVDLDNFKTINDKHGHLTGDRVLQIIAHCIAQNSRDVDIHGRYGGDEFIILLPETEQSYAQIFAERLCEIIPTSMEDIKEINEPVTLSIGIANFSWEADITIDTLFEQADKALYAGKEAGRNCIKIWDGG